MFATQVSRSLAATAAALAVAVIGACSDSNDATAPTTPEQSIACPSASVTGSTEECDAHIFALLHESNLGEIQAGQLALDRATNDSVRAFAQQMVTDHTTLDQQGMALAQQLGITPALPDSALPKTIAQELAQLQQLTGADFDVAYMQSQVVDHQRTLAIVQASIQLTETAQLDAMLQNTVQPMIQMHLERAQSILSQLQNQTK